MAPARIVLREGAELEGFRRAARSLIARQITPRDVIWSCDEAPELFPATQDDTAPSISLPRAVSELVDLVICHRDPDRYALLYTLIWRVLHGERDLLQVHSDPVVHRLEMLRKAIRRDLHKMHAFVRFRRVEDAAGERFISWFEPDHFIVAATADFFVQRFRGLVWSILTPVGSLHWDRHSLTIGPPGHKADLPEGDGFEAGWVQYYESTFNPARTNPNLMRKEMPVRYWRNLPEAQSIEGLIQTAPARVKEMIDKGAAMSTKRTPLKAVAAMADQNPGDLTELNRIISSSEPLVPGATRAVLGEGPIGAAIAFVGEQPGDQEDLQGRPFVGPAGQLLNDALEQAGIDRGQAYLTNAVKHFKFEQRGKRRLHQSPTSGEVRHYRWWLEKELAFVRPNLVVALGATAAFALSDRKISVVQARGELQFGVFRGYVTVHPSYLLRLPDEHAKRAAFAAFLDDLRRVAEFAYQPQPAA
jgi:uracil-DNA glycosylase